MRLPKDESGEWIFQNCDLFFDPDEPLNGSLYICLPRRRPVPTCIIEDMRQRSIWSDAKEKIVADSKRKAYKQQLKFLEAYLCYFHSEFIVISRFDHEKFRSNLPRWDCWKAFFGCLGS